MTVDSDICFAWNYEDQLKSRESLNPVTLQVFSSSRVARHARRDSRNARGWPYFSPVLYLNLRQSCQVNDIHSQFTLFAQKSLLFVYHLLHTGALVSSQCILMSE